MGTKQNITHMNCKNCEESLKENAIYCLNCGARVIKNRLTIKNLFSHALEQYFNVDNRFLMTFAHMLIKPHHVIDTYITGMRKRYINPISYFALALTLSGALIFLIRRLDLVELVFSQFTPDPNSMVGNPEVNQKMMDSMGPFLDTTLEYNGLFFILYIPLLAIPSWISFLGEKYNLTEHLVAYIYILSQYSFVASFFGIVFLLFAPQHYGLFGYTLLTLVIIYSLLIMKSIFQLSILQMVFRTFLFFILIAFSFFGLGILVWIILFATGTMSPADFIPPK